MTSDVMSYMYLWLLCTVHVDVMSYMYLCLLCTVHVECNQV